MRIEVVNGDLHRALKLWQQLAAENRTTLARQRWFYGPAEARRRKDRLARKRSKRRVRQHLVRRSVGNTTGNIR
jgi:ribosomal protein S21